MHCRLQRLRRCEGDEAAGGSAFRFSLIAAVLCLSGSWRRCGGSAESDGLIDALISTRPRSPVAAALSLNKTSR